MRIEKILSIILMSVVICFAAGVFGVFFNILNPGRISLVPENAVITPGKMRAGPAQKPVPGTAQKNKEKIKTAVVLNPKILPPVVKPALKNKTEVRVVLPLVIEKPAATKEAVLAVKVDDRTVNLEQAKLLFDGKKAVFVDARPEYTYIDKHIKGAISLSASRFNFQYEQKKEDLNKEELYVVYCSSVTCHLSDFVADYLRENGFKNVKKFTAGWDSWVAAGFPVEGLKVKVNGGKNE